MLKIRRPLGRLIFNMGIAIPGKTVFLIETAPRWNQCYLLLCRSVQEQITFSVFLILPHMLGFVGLVLLVDIWSSSWVLVVSLWCPLKPWFAIPWNILLHGLFLHSIFNELSQIFFYRIECSLPVHCSFLMVVWSFPEELSKFSVLDNFQITSNNISMVSICRSRRWTFTVYAIRVSFLKSCNCFFVIEESSLHSRAILIAPPRRGFWSPFGGVCSLTYCNGNFRVTMVSEPFNVIL